MTNTNEKTLDLHQFLTPFVNYCHSFYGKGGLYDMGASLSQLYEAAATYLLSPDREAEFEGDSFDREQVREILHSWGMNEIKT
jgi:hypothetical protein